VHLWLRNIGLEDHWIRQDTGDAWKTTARAAVELADQRSWRAGSAGKSKLRDYRRWKALPGWERYLDSRDEQGRRRLTKARGGILEVSEETGRWERISVQGKQVPVPRHLRWCEQCLIETEDLRHLLLVCPGYRKVRAEFFGQVASAPGASRRTSRTGRSGFYPRVNRPSRRRQRGRRGATGLDDERQRPGGHDEAPH